MISASIRALILVLLVWGLVAAAEETHVVIMHTNDIRGHILQGPDAGGSARLATVVRQVKPDLMLDAGGILSGSLLSDTFQGEPVVAAMNAIGYDAVAIGSSEFNFGISALRARSHASVMGRAPGTGCHRACALCNMPGERSTP